MSNPVQSQIDAALCTPPRDMRDEVWLRVYSQLVAAGETAPVNAAQAADFAVGCMPIPRHRRAEVGLA